MFKRKLLNIGHDILKSLKKWCNEYYWINFKSLDLNMIILKYVRKVTSLMCFIKVLLRRIFRYLLNIWKTKRKSRVNVHLQKGDIFWFQLIVVDNSKPVSETDNYITNINPINLDSPETVFVLFLIRYNGRSAEYVKLIHKV